MLTPVTNVAREQVGEARDLLLGRFQCLRCGHEFKPEEPGLGLDSEEGWRPLFQKTGTRPALDLSAHTPPLFQGKWLCVGECKGGAPGRRG